MPVYVAFLRGVNVGGRNKISMETLRSLIAQLGYSTPRTVLQSGNVAFGADGTSPQVIIRELESRLRDVIGRPVPVVIRTAQEVQDVAARVPFGPGKLAEPGKLLCFFSSRAIPQDALQDFLLGHRGPEEVRPPAAKSPQADTTEIYVHYPQGLGKSTLDNALLDRRLGAVLTGRNWNTLGRVIAMSEELEP